MNQELLNEISKLRNDARHQHRHLNLTDFTSRLTALGLSVSASELSAVLPALQQALGPESGQFFVPQVVLQVLTTLLAGRVAHVVCDPWAGLGAVISTIQAATHAEKAVALTRNEAEALLGRFFAKNAEWQLGDPLQILSELPGEMDVFAGVLPFGVRCQHSVKLPTAAGLELELAGDLGDLILATASQKLSVDGMALFVVPSSLFASQRLCPHLDGLGIGIEAALALPSGTFAPYTSVSTYLAIIRRHPIPRTFVAQLSRNANTNGQIVANLIEGKEGGSVQLGRYVDVGTFVGLEVLAFMERFKELRDRMGAPAVRLREIATEIRLGRPGAAFSFQRNDNAVYVPLIGSSDVVGSVESLSLKAQNYAQVVIDPARSHARFVAQFLNSEVGQTMRAINKTGVIPKLNTKSLGELLILIPDLQTQQAMLEIETRATAEQNTLLGLQNELRDVRLELWNNPRAIASADRRLQSLSDRLTPGLKRHTVLALDQWVETLPFPLASILRAWQATPDQDFKQQYEHLLHFFEASAEFVSAILLSAFSSREALFDEHRDKLQSILAEQHLSFQRATFGTWKVVVEYLGKRTRELLAGDDNSRALCADMFADHTMALPRTLARKELATVLSVTNKMRNDWTGHAGVVNPSEAKSRNEQLLAEVQRVREVMADLWNDIQLVNALNCRPRRGVFENEVALLKGSNSEFLKETREMSVWLDVEELYVTAQGATQALKLLPLVRIGPSPESAKNACYFFNRVEAGTLRFISYHFADRPEFNEPFRQMPEAIRFLSEP